MSELLGFYGVRVYVSCGVHVWGSVSRGSGGDLLVCFVSCCLLLWSGIRAVFKDFRVFGGLEGVGLDASNVL